MKFDAIKQRLSPFGTVGVSRSGNQIAFHMETTLEGADTIEELGMVAGDIPSATLVITGNNDGEARIIVQVDYDEIETVPPYIQEDR